jgi:cytochrome c-type biogenesis protein CcmH/NrfF
MSFGLMDKRSRLWLLSALCLGLISWLAAGDDSARIERLGHQMMCVCGCNQLLLECNHVGCRYSDQMRAELSAAVDHGTSDSEIVERFIEKYGTTVLAAPTKTGFNRLAWLMPYVALAAGIAGVILTVGAWRARARRVPAFSTPATSGTELDRYREQARRETAL